MISRRPLSPSFPVSGADEPLTRIGRDLRSARLERGEDLYDIADILRIRPIYLEALEAGDAAVMPGRPYLLGFMKCYADYLGLDGRALAQSLKDAGRDVAAAPALVYRTPTDQPARPTKALAAISIVFAVLVYGGWHGYSSGQLDLDETLATLPLQLGEAAADLVSGGTLVTPPAGPPPIVDVPMPEPGTALMVPEAPTPPAGPLLLTVAEAAVEPGAALAAGRPPAGDASSAQAAERLPAEGLSPQPPPSAEPSPARQSGEAPAASAGAMLAALEGDRPDDAARAFGGAADAVRIQLVARESSWVQVRSRSRDYVRTRTLQPGDRLALPNRSDLSLWTGNAGGLELMVDGRSVGVIGARGSVVRELALDPDRLLKGKVTAR
jgi:cytoskeleton protein RodZ